MSGLRFIHSGSSPFQLDHEVRVDEQVEVGDHREVRFGDELEAV